MSNIYRNSLSTVSFRNIEELSNNVKWYKTNYTIKTNCSKLKNWKEKISITKYICMYIWSSHIKHFLKWYFHDPSFNTLIAKVWKKTHSNFFSMRAPFWNLYSVCHLPRFWWILRQKTIRGLVYINYNK